MKVLIIEDNISVSLEYEMILNKLGIKDILVFKTWHKAVGILKEVVIDFMIIDIYLDQGENGFKFLETLGDHNTPFIICSGYPKETFMQKAFDLGAYGFFSKPLDKPAFTYLLKTLVASIKEKTINTEYFTIKDGRVLKKIPQKDLIYIRVEGNYAFVHTKHQNKMVIKSSLKALAKELNQVSFVRSHRSVIVNLHEIKELDFENNLMVLNTDEKLPIGATYKQEIRNLFLNL